MKDNWKKLINENREEFNSEQPRDIFFEKIALQLESKKEPKMIRLSLVWQMAASIIVIFGVMLFFLLRNNPSEKENVVENTKSNSPLQEKMVLAKLDPQLAETEYYYVSQIDDLMEEVDKKELSPDVRELIKQLDTEFNLLRKEIGDQVNSDQIIEALIENYRLKIKLLEKILESYSNENSNNNEAGNRG